MSYRVSQKKTGHFLTFLGNLGTERPKVPKMAKKVPRIAKPKKYLSLIRKVPKKKEEGESNLKVSHLHN